MKKYTIFSLALVCGSVIGTSAYAGSGTPTALLGDGRPCGFVQFSDAPTTWYSVPSAFVWQVIVGAAISSGQISYTVGNPAFDTCGGIVALASATLGSPR